MQKPPTSFTLSVLLAFALGGCASADGRYPSLAVRDAERAQGTLNPSPPSQPSAIGITDLDALMAPLDRARDADAKFAAQKDEVNALIAASSGLGPEDDRRARALIGYAELTSLRGQTALALSDLDQLETSSATQFKRTKDINDLQTSIQRMIAQQDETLDSLSEMLSQ
jgi:hypothetical protein